MSLSRKGFLKMLGFGALAAGSKAYGLPAKALEAARADAKKLKITDVEIFLFDIGLTSPFRIAIGTMTAANDLLVRVRHRPGRSSASARPARSRRSPARPRPPTPPPPRPSAT